MKILRLKVNAANMHDGQTRTAGDQRLKSCFEQQQKCDANQKQSF